MKTCSVCGQLKPLEEFYARKIVSDGKRSECKTCNKQKRNEFNNTIVGKEKAIASREKYITFKTNQIYSLLNQNPCVDCGEKDILVLDFDHLPGSKKEFSIARGALRHSWEKIKAEIDKCEVVCANCHRRRTAKRGNWRKLKWNPEIS